ncbi:unnamed protein product [Lactuca saligna]|uniref:Uncharacterized protein n=1 Tax=Lactuca saligna TaxID=75948 RepID=A0AA36E5W1_LACSI|nr:unnamed protein product [Lactuca saligna]
MWIIEDDGAKRKSVECIHFKTILKADTDRNEASNMNKHWRNCKLNPDNKEKHDKKQVKLNFKKEPNGETSIQTWKHDDARIKRALLGLFTVSELSFKWLIESSTSQNESIFQPERFGLTFRA